MAEEKEEIEIKTQQNPQLMHEDDFSVEVEQNEAEGLKNANSAALSENSSIELPKEIAEERLNVIMDAQKPQKRKKSSIISMILLLVNIVFMVIIIRGLLNNMEGQSFVQYVKMQGKRLWWLVGGVACYILYIFAQTIMFRALIKSSTGKSNWKLAYNVGVTGKYYDNVTPFAVGGQPMQIFELAKSGISPGTATSLPLIKMIINSIVSTILALIFFVFGLPKIAPTNSFFALLFVVFEILGVIGLIITFFGNLFMIILSTGSLFTRSLIAWLVKVGYKLKIVKNYRATLKKSLDQVTEYKTSGKYLLKNKKVLFKMILYSCLETLSYAGISFFVIMAFLDPAYLTNNNVSVGFILFNCIVKYYICSMAGSYIPLPGATGLMEIAFIALYGEFVGDAIVWALLTWRILSYYLILVHGFFNELSKIIKNMILSKKTKRETLEQENIAGGKEKISDAK